MIERIGLKWAGIAIAVLFWPLEAALHAFVFGKGAFAGNLFPADADELWMRSLISAAFIAFGLIGQRRLADLREFQQRIQIKRSRLQQIIDSAYDAYVAIDGQGHIIGWNRSAEKMFGWPVGEVMGRPLTGILIPERYRKAHSKGIRRYMDTGIGPKLYRPVQMEALHRDGSEFGIEMVITPLKHDGSQEFFAFIRKR